MRKHFYLLTLTLALIACNKNGSTVNDPESDTTKVIPAALTADKNDSITEQATTTNDSLISYEDSLFVDLQPKFQEISKTEFVSYKNKYKTNCAIDSGQFISGSGLYVDGGCNEICETYLVEKSSKYRMLIPSSYDQGILKMLLSPKCNKLVVCSSYDGPDYVNYYQDRAEIIGYSVAIGDGLNGIKPAFKLYTKDWSIDDLTWIDNNSIAIKTYEESRTLSNENNLCKYFKINLHK